MDKKIFIWDTSNGFIVAKHVTLPDQVNCMRWGGFVKDIKGRNTELYQLATAGNKQMVLWKLDTNKGKLLIFLNVTEKYYLKILLSLINFIKY